MSEDEARREDETDVEAHKRQTMTANEEPRDEAEADDEVEAHKFKGKLV